MLGGAARPTFHENYSPGRYDYYNADRRRIDQPRPHSSMYLSRDVPQKYYNNPPGSSSRDVPQKYYSNTAGSNSVEESGSNETHPNSLFMKLPDKSFKCLLCDYVSHITTNMRNHVRVHVGQKPFKCPYCDNGYTQKKNMTAHVSRYHPEQCRDWFVNSSGDASFK